MRYSAPKPTCSGFTLIELSIVLVIIGLIVGGILVGRDMINNAAIRATISDIQNIETAIRTFQTKYNCLPGDCANATDYFGQSANCPDPDSNGTCNGDGDGHYSWIDGHGGESNWAAEELYRSHLIHYYSSNGGVEFPWTQIVRPPSGIPYAAAFIYTNDLFSPNPGTDSIGGRNGNDISLGSQAHDCISGVSESAVNAQQIDMKMDDGHAAGGAVFGLSGSKYDPTLSGGGGGGCGPSAPSCLNGTEYDTANPTAACRMLFYWSS